jgi:hypothetical protein
MAGFLFCGCGFSRSIQDHAGRLERVESAASGCRSYPHNLCASLWITMLERRQVTDLKRHKSRGQIMGCWPKFSVIWQPLHFFMVVKD